MFRQSEHFVHDFVTPLVKKTKESPRPEERGGISGHGGSMPKAVGNPRPYRNQLLSPRGRYRRSHAMKPEQVTQLEKSILQLDGELRRLVADAELQRILMIIHK